MPKSKDTRSEHTATLLTKDEREKVERAAEHDRRSVSAFMRLAVLDKADEVVGQQKRHAKTA